MHGTDAGTPAEPEPAASPESSPGIKGLLSPHSVALIGATERPGSVGRAVVENLKGFSGPTYLVNSLRPFVLGQQSWPSVGQLPGPVDLAIIATPAHTVPALIGQCVDAGIPSAVILSAGFKETGAVGMALENAVLQQMRGRIGIVGPNCLGVMSPHLGLNATFAAALARPGTVAFLSQSGALCTAILDWSLQENVGFSGFVSTGSMLDVNWGDLINHYGADPHTQSIVIYMESIGDARAFLSAARRVARTKPIIVLKVGRTSAAAQAAASHTGALTGSDAVLNAAFRRAGVLRVNAIEELFDMAEVLSKQPRPLGPRLTIITNAGGPGALATDALVGHGGSLAPLSQASLSALNAFLPGPWSHGNPVDILGDADAERYGKAVEIAVQDAQTDGVLVVLTPQAMTDATATASRISKVANADGKPILASWMGGGAVAPGEDILNQARIPTFKYPDRAARAFTLMWRHTEVLRTLDEAPTSAASLVPPGAPAAVEALIQSVQQRHRVLLTEVEAKQALAAYGIGVVPTVLTLTPQEAVEQAEHFGFPVVLKLFSETLTHKTDVGGVKLNLGTADAVRQAWTEIETAVRIGAGPGHFLGATVQPMIRRDGYELILGCSTDPQFGPVLLFGAGGQLVEILQDSALGLPPLTPLLARRLIEQTRISVALQGVRGRPPVNLVELEHLLVRFSELVIQHPRIAELDINPLLVSAEGSVALDARILLHPANRSDEQLPRPSLALV